MSHTAWALFVVSYLATACNESFDPYQGTASELTAFGYIVAHADTQWIRVVPGRKTLDRPDDYSNSGIELRLSNGQRTVAFRDSVVSIGDSIRALVFYTTEPFEPNTSWKMEVSGPGYSTVTASISIPRELAKTDMLVDEPYLFGGEHMQTYFFEKLSEYFIIEHYYLISYHAEGPFTPVYYRLSGTDYLVESTRGLHVTINHTKDRWQLLRTNGFDPTQPYYLKEGGVRVIFASDDWVPPNGAWDAQTAILPGVFSNTSNGLGFVGGVSLNTAVWHPRDPLETEAIKWCMASIVLQPIPCCSYRTDQRGCANPNPTPFVP